MSKEIQLAFLILGLVSLFFVIVNLYYIFLFTHSEISVNKFEKAIPIICEAYFKNSAKNVTNNLKIPNLQK